MAKLIITVEGEISDLEWIRNHAVPAVEEVVSDAQDENRLENPVETYWDIED